MNFNQQLSFYKNLAEDRLKAEFDVPDCKQKTVYAAMQYSINAGGKRIRPILTLAAADMLGGDLQDALRFAVGIECIHTYSLIHDDLPCMDNDDLRRGMPTCHKKFGEATALLAGDGLLTFAFQYMSDIDKYTSVKAESVIRIINEISRCAGCDGMIGGQIVDLDCEGRDDVDETTLTYMHNRKTGALIRCSLLAGGICAGASMEHIQALTDFADGIGLAFQIQDDILDCVGTQETLGKPIGSDAENKKTTYVTLLGIENAKAKARELTDEAIKALEIFDDKAEFLRQLAESLICRNY